MTVISNFDFTCPGDAVEWQPSSQLQRNESTMTHNEARNWAISKIVKIERPTLERNMQICRLDDWDLANVFYKHFGYDWQALIS